MAKAFNISYAFKLPPYTWTIPSSICSLPSYASSSAALQLQSLTGEILNAIKNLTSIRMLSPYGNFVSGHIPMKLGQFSRVVVLDLSEKVSFLLFMLMERFSSCFLWNRSSFHNCQKTYHFRMKKLAHLKMPLKHDNRFLQANL